MNSIPLQQHITQSHQQYQMDHQQENIFQWHQSDQPDPLQQFYDYKDSQMYKLQIKDSAIPGSGKGLFATKSIDPGEIILEYYGAIIPSEACNDAPFQMEDKMVYLNEDYCVVSRGPASRANDPIVWEPQKYDSLEYKMLRKKKTFKSHPNCERNAKITLLQKDKAFLTALSPIKPGDEIFIDYGFEYWDFFFKKASENINGKVF